MTGERRWPIADLEQLVAARLTPIVVAGQLVGVTDGRIADTLGITARTLRRWRERGLLTDDQADRAAVAAGIHPAEVWPNWGTVPCDECGAPFVPRHRRHRFCSKRCGHRHGNREWNRRRYQSDPSFAEAERVRRRQNYADCVVYERAQSAQRAQARRARKAA